MKTVKLTETMTHNNLEQLGLEFRSYAMSALLISQYFDGRLRHLPDSTLDIQHEGFLEGVHEIATGVPVPEGILEANEHCCWYQDGNGVSRISDRKGGIKQTGKNAE